MAQNYQKWVNILKEYTGDGLPVNFPKELLEDKNFIIYAIHNYLINEISPYIGESLKNDLEVVKVVIKEHGECIKYFPLYTDDKEIALIAVNSFGPALKHLSSRLQDDEEMVSIAIKNGRSLEFASERFKDDDAVAFSAVKDNPYAIRFVSLRLIKDREFILKVLSANGRALLIGMDNPDFASMHYNEDPELVKAAVTNFGMALEVASDALKSDREIVIVALDESHNDPKSVSESPLRYVSKDLLHDKDIVRFAIKNCSNAIEYLPEELMNDRDFILLLVQINGAIYEFLPKRYLDDKEITLVAVSYDGIYLYRASDRLKDDKEVAMAALKNHGSFDVRDLLELYVSPRLQEDPEIQMLVDNLLNN